MPLIQPVIIAGAFHRKQPVSQSMFHGEIPEP
jgi:hypothetical protein